MKTARLAGIVGMILIHSSSIPGILSVVNGGNIPPMEMIAQNCLALSLLSFHAAHFRVWLYLFGNLAGLIGQLILLGMILAR